MKSIGTAAGWSLFGLCLIVGEALRAHADDPVTRRPAAPPLGAASTLASDRAREGAGTAPAPASGSVTAAADPQDHVSQPVTSPGYLLQPGDVLQIAVWKETELTAEVLIRPDGGIAFPLAGEIQVAGHTVAELTATLEQRIRKFEPDAVITVGVKVAAGNRVYVIGKVTRPGDFPLNRPTDVMQALSLAGGATPFANINGIRILRRVGAGQTSIAFRYHDVERGRRLDQNILLQSGDTVVVP